jgi:hypothetical protein
MQTIRTEGGIHSTCTSREFQQCAGPGVFLQFGEVLGVGSEVPKQKATKKVVVLGFFVSTKRKTNACS